MTSSCSSFHKVTSVCRKIALVIKAFPVNYNNMAAGFSADLCASSLSVCWDVTTRNKMRKALNFPLSSHSVGLITTSYSVLQPLRKHRTLLRQNALAKNMAFMNCNSCLILCLGSDPTTVGATSTAAFNRTVQAELPSAYLNSKGPFLDLFFISGTVLRSAEAFQKKVYLGEKTLKELSYFHVLCFILFCFLPFFLL